MLSLVLSGALSYASGAARIENGKGQDGTSIVIIQNTCYGGSEKSSSIQASIDGHTLTVVFTENLGQVAIDVTTATGTIVQTYWMNTPDGLQSYMANTGDYIITFTLTNGDEYYGEFTVTD